MLCLVEGFQRNSYCLSHKWKPIVKDKYEIGPLCLCRSMSQDEGHYSHDPTQHQQQANPNRHHEQRENPIYGNISSNRRGERRPAGILFTSRLTVNMKTGGVSLIP